MRDSDAQPDPYIDAIAAGHGSEYEPAYDADQLPPLDTPRRKPDMLSEMLMQQQPELAGHVHYVNGRPWCDGVLHTTMCDPEHAAPPLPGQPGYTPPPAGTDRHA